MSFHEQNWCFDCPTLGANFGDENLGWVVMFPKFLPTLFVLRCRSFCVARKMLGGCIAV
jgi:hypothetical protein